MANRSDFPYVLSLYAGAVRKMREMGIDQWDELYPDRDLLLQDIERREMLLAESGGELVSAFVVNEEQSPEYKEVDWHICRVDPPGVIHRLCVCAQAQGKGLGKRTLEAAEQRARTLGYHAIRLDSFTENPSANKLYQSAGYQKAGTVRFRKGIFICYEKLLEGKR